MFDLSLERSRNGTVAALPMLPIFAVLFLMPTRLPAQQSAALALNEPARVQIETLRGSGSVARWIATMIVQSYPRYQNATVDALVEALESPELRDRIAAATVLGRRGPAAKAAVPALIVALKDPNAEVRYKAAVSLGSIGRDAKAAVPALVETLKDQDIVVQTAATVGLRGIGPDADAAIPALSEAAISPIGVNAAIALTAMGDAGVTALISALRNADVRDRVYVVLALGNVTSYETTIVPVLMEMLKDGYPEVRIATVDALGNIGPSAKAAVPALVKAQKDSDARVRKAAETALDRIEQ